MIQTIFLIWGKKKLLWWAIAEGGGGGGGLKNMSVFMIIQVPTGTWSFMLMCRFSSEGKFSPSKKNNRDTVVFTQTQREM